MTGAYSESRWQIKITGNYPMKTTSKPTVKKPLAKGEFNPPKHEIDSIARCIFPAIQAYFNTETGRKEFAAWQAKQRSENKIA